MSGCNFEHQWKPAHNKTWVVVNRSINGSLHLIKHEWSCLGASMEAWTKKHEWLWLSNNGKKYWCERLEALIKACTRTLNAGVLCEKGLHQCRMLCVRGLHTMQGVVCEGSTHNAGCCVWEVYAQCRMLCVRGLHTMQDVVCVRGLHRT
jgi:hypothetical protein